MDFISDLPLVQRGSERFNGVLVLVDKYSRLCRLIPVFKGEGELAAPVVAQLVFEHVVKLFGVPESLVSDRDPRFTSDFWRSLWDILGTRLHLSSAYHPQSDGQTERHNRTIE